jgi:sialate O-acetylesterase
MTISSVKWSLALVGLLTAASAGADVKLPAIIGDNMVLQQGMKPPIWGWADPGEKVTVSLNGKEISSTADSQGRWQVKLPKMKAGGPYDVTISGKNTITLHNVLVGEVWVGSGQSNMEFGVGGANNAQQEISSAHFPQIRMFTVAKKVGTEPLADVEGHWVECSPQTVGGFSAVAYFFGRDLHQKLGVPVGLIHTSWGGTPAEAWTSRPTLEADSDLRYMVENWDKQIADYPKTLADYNQRVKDWQDESDKARAAGTLEPKKPDQPQDPRDNPWLTGGLYNAMIAPLIPYSIKGAIWYQGESNADRAYQYRKLFPTMIRNWRQAWGEGDFPFLFVQLANWMNVKPEPSEDAWAELREAQSKTLALPKTGMAVIIDIGDAADIHPKDKQDVGHRLALAAYKVAYGQDLVYSGPTYKSMKVEGDKIRLRFTHVGGGLVAREGGALKGFEIAGADRKFVWADATIDGDSIVVSSSQVQKPVAVRYAWAANPMNNLANKEGLLASPFRTDDWPGVTVGKR